MPCSIGVLVLEEEDEEGLDLGVYAIYIEIIAWTMVGIGGLYFIMVSHSCFTPVCLYSKVSIPYTLGVVTHTFLSLK